MSAPVTMLLVVVAGQIAWILSAFQTKEVDMAFNMLKLSSKSAKNYKELLM